MKNDVFLIGHLAYKKDSIDGQTIKTRNVKKLLEHAGLKVGSFDTQLLKYNPLYYFKALINIPRQKKVVILLGSNGLSYLLPPVFLFCKLFRKELYYIVIGGWLPQFLTKKPVINYIVKRMDKVFVETGYMKKQLTEAGHKNATILPNFKVYQFEKEASIHKEPACNRPLKVVFLSRVTEAKGLDIIEKLAHKIEDEKLPFTIDLYGPVLRKEEKYVQDIMAISNQVNYKGTAKPEEVHTVLSKYDVLLFPTHYVGEGFPGVILDAYIAGLPVIASNWKYNSELVTNQTGFLFDLENWEAIADQLWMLYNNPSYLNDLKKNAYEMRERYSIDYVVDELKQEGLLV